MSAESAPASKPVGPGDQVILVDGSSFIFRAYFQSINQDQKYNSRPSDGLPTGAVRLFCTKIAQFLQDGAAGTMPTHLGIVFDKSEGSFRKEMFPDYKGHRPDAPDDLKRQMPLMRDAVRAFGLHAVELERYEADDLIATYARQAEARGAGVIIVSSDKDLMQLVGPLVRFYDFESGAKGKPGYRPERNLDPNQIGDALALIGDTSDNVPGVPGIGLKTAAALIKEFGSLDALLERAGEIKQPKRRETLLANIEQAKLSRKLVALMEDVPVPVPLDDLTVPEPDPEKLVGFLKAMEFNTLTRRIAQMLHVDPEKVKPDPALLPGAKRAPDPETAAAGTERPPGAAPPEGGEVDPFADLGLPDVAPKPRGPAEPTPGGLVAARAAESVKPFDTDAYETVLTLDQLDAWIAEAEEAGVIAVDTETDALDSYRAGLVGISLATAPGRACYIPLAHVRAVAAPADAGDLFGQGAASSDAVEPVAEQIPLDAALARLKPLLEIPACSRSGRTSNTIGSCRPLRRHDADFLRARCRQGRTRHGRTRPPPSRPPADHLLGRRRHRPGESHLRPGRPRQGHGLRRRGRGRDAPPVADDEAAPRGRAAGRRLRDPGTAPPADHRAHGDGRHPRRPGHAEPPLGRFLADPRASRRRDPGGCGGEVLRRLAEADRRHPVRQDGPARRQEDALRPMGDARHAAGRTGPGGP
ncbi:hypothetical protein Lal_00041128 [Lupinus albus]|nr:hypothetical protein Lal_00041128 [Lupinus albus]